MDLTNRYAVGAFANRGNLFMLSPPRPTIPITPAEALVLAAYLVSLADPDGTRFPGVLKAVQEQ